MLSPQSLERTTRSYARGYRHGYFGEARIDLPSVDLGKPFAVGDYTDGYEAGANDRKWDDHRSANQR